ncbi:MAG: hypothetical protein M3R13_02315 [Armatimonadota bacterium]|nr:hypothetical protein [Armatimonadota bacterium]
MKANGSPIVKYGIAALLLLGAIFAYTRFTGRASTDDGIGEVPKPTTDVILPPLEDKYIIGKGGYKAPGK